MNQYALLTHPDHSPQAVNIGSIEYAELLLLGYKKVNEGKKREMIELLESMEQD